MNAVKTKKWIMTKNKEAPITTQINSGFSMIDLIYSYRSEVNSLLATFYIYHPISNII